MTPTASGPIVFVNQHYAPDVASTGQHLTDLAEYLVENGFEVKVICGRSGYVGGSLDAPRQEKRNGVDVTRVWTTAFGRRNHLGRLLDYLSFFCSVLLGLLSKRVPASVVVYLTTPPLLPFVGRVVKTVRGTEYGVWAMDLHPEAEEVAGIIRSGGLISRVLRWCVGCAYRGASFIVDLGPYMKRRLGKYDLDEGKLHTIPVWSQAEEVYPVDRDENPLVDDFGVRNEFVVMYSGNAGLAHRFDEVLDAMAVLDRQQSPIHFLFIGDGPRKGEIVDFIRERQLQNASYHGYVSRTRLAWSLSVGQVHLLTLRDEMAGIAVPGKLFGIIAAGRPVLMVGPRQSEPAQIIEANGCGWVVDPSEDSGPVEKIISLLQRLSRDPGEAQRRGQQGLKAFRAEFCADRILPRWADLIESELQGNEDIQSPPPVATRLRDPGRIGYRDGLLNGGDE